MPTGPINTSLEDPIINYCKEFWKAMMTGDELKLEYYWRVIWRLRDQQELFGVAHKCWEELYHTMTQLFPKFEVDIAAFVIQIQYMEKGALHNTKYYRECLAQHASNNKRGKIRLLPQASNNPYKICVNKVY